MPEITGIIMGIDYERQLPISIIPACVPVPRFPLRLKSRDTY